MLFTILFLAPLLAALGHALPQVATCATITRQIVVPTKTVTYSSVEVVTVHPTTAKNLGVFTLITTISETTTLQTLTTTTPSCASSGTVYVPVATTTVYGRSNFPKRGLGLKPRQDHPCVRTVTSYTTYGQTYTYVPAGRTSTFSDYSAFTQTTVTSVKTGGKAYAVATSLAAQPTACGNATVTRKGYTSTVTLDPKCAPTSMISAWANYGLKYLSDTPTSGATWKTNTTDASSCCQLCATSWQCAASAWDIRTGECRLEFPVQWDTGNMNCGTGLMAYYGAGPAMPMLPGTGWYVATLCGAAAFGNAEPDDGS